MDAFDSDVLIYAVLDDPRGPSIRQTLAESDHWLGSMVLLPELLTRPLRRGDDAEHRALKRLLGRFDLKPVDLEVATASVTLGATYTLRAADAIHLATAVVWGAERFHTNNRKDFGPHITEIEIVYPASSMGRR